MREIKSLKNTARSLKVAAQGMLDEATRLEAVQ